VGVKMCKGVSTYACKPTSIHSSTRSLLWPTLDSSSCCDASSQKCSTNYTNPTHQC